MGFYPLNNYIQKRQDIQGEHSQHINIMLKKRKKNFRANIIMYLQLFPLYLLQQKINKIKFPDHLLNFGEVKRHYSKIYTAYLLKWMVKHKFHYLFQLI